MRNDDLEPIVSGGAGLVRSELEKQQFRNVYEFLDIYASIIMEDFEEGASVRESEIDEWVSEAEDYEQGFDRPPTKQIELYEEFAEAVEEIPEDYFDTALGVATGGLPFSDIFAKLKDCEMAIADYSWYEHRDKDADILDVGDELEGQNVAVVDDSISSGRTAYIVKEKLREQNPENIHMIFPHQGSSWESEGTFIAKAVEEEFVSPEEALELSENFDDGIIDQGVYNFVPKEEEGNNGFLGISLGL